MLVLFFEVKHTIADVVMFLFSFWNIYGRRLCNSLMVLCEVSQHSKVFRIEKVLLFGLLGKKTTTCCKILVREEQFIVAIT